MSQQQAANEALVRGVEATRRRASAEGRLCQQFNQNNNLNNPFDSFNDKERRILQNPPPTHTQDEHEADEAHDGPVCPIAQAVPSTNNMVK